MAAFLLSLLVMLAILGGAGSSTMKPSGSQAADSISGGVLSPAHPLTGAEGCAGDNTPPAPAAGPASRGPSAVGSRRFRGAFDYSSCGTLVAGACAGPGIAIRRAAHSFGHRRR